MYIAINETEGAEPRVLPVQRRRMPILILFSRSEAFIRASTSFIIWLYDTISIGWSLFLWYILLMPLSPAFLSYILIHRLISLKGWQSVMSFQRFTSCFPKSSNLLLRPCELALRLYYRAYRQKYWAILSHQQENNIESFCILSAGLFFLPS